MADFLVIDGLPVPIEYPDGASKDAPEEIGDRGRAFAGNEMTSIRAWKDKWPFRTTWVTRAEADALLAKLTSAPPISCYGEAIGVVMASPLDCTVRLMGEDIGTDADGSRIFRVKFELGEE